MKMALLAWSGVAACTAAVAGAVTMAPDALRRVDEFHVARVIVHGTDYLDSREALVASGITRAASVFDDAEPWLRALRGHPLIRDVRIERELPATLHIHVQETQPLAFVRTPELRPVDVAGRLLPVRAGHRLDLPVLIGEARLGTLAVPAPARRLRAFTRVIDEPTLGVLAQLADIARVDPAFAARISEALALPGGDVRITLRDRPHAAVLLPQRIDAAGLQRVWLTLLHLEGSSGPLRIDARLHDQVVVADATASAVRGSEGGVR